MFQASHEEEDEDVFEVVQMSTGRELHGKALPLQALETHNGIQDTGAPLKVSCPTALDPGLTAALPRAENLHRGC